MIDYETYYRIKQYQQEGLKAGQIARNLELDPRTVESWLEKHPYTATQIYQRLQEDGYQRSYSLVKRYVRKVRPKHAQTVVIEGKSYHMKDLVEI